DGVPLRADEWAGLRGDEGGGPEPLGRGRAGRDVDAPGAGGAVRLAGRPGGVAQPDRRPGAARAGTGAAGRATGLDGEDRRPAAGGIPQGGGGEIGEENGPRGSGLSPGGAAVGSQGRQP